MGKSSKKIKSDRINALRKQYDAFLDEDKKRKERNEYILGRLDKMRYSTALLPLRHKFAINPDRNAAHYRSARQQEIPLTRDYQLSCTNPIQIIPECPVSNVEGPETFLMQEISKKYILIPKLRSTFTNNYIKDVKPAFDIEPAVESKGKKRVNISDVDNVDWKSKYEILNILKKEEKEEALTQFNKATPLDKPDKELINNNNEENIEPVTINRDCSEGQKYLKEIPEKDLPDKLDYGISTATAQYAPINQYDADRYSVDANHGIYEQTENHQITPNVVQNDPISDINLKLLNTNLEYNHGEQPVTNRPLEYTEYEQNVENQPAQFTEYEQNIENQPAEYTEYKQNIGLHPEYEVNTEFEDQQDDNTENAMENVANTHHIEAKPSRHDELDPTEQFKNIERTENVIVDENPMQRQSITPSVFAEEVNKPPLSVEPEVSADDVEYPVDIINVQEFTPNDDVQLKEGVNINPEEHIMQQSNIEPPNQQDIPQLGANTEQPQKPVDTTGIEEFEAEQQGMFYSEQTDENYAYQGGADNVYNPEFAQNEAYQQNEYAYYEGTQPEVYQPVDINEHEETTQQYDQNYEQQYVGTYEQGYEQQPYEQNDQVYQESEAYPGQPEVDQLHYQQQNEETPEHVQQVLDNEQGYAEIQNIVEANEQDLPPTAKTNEAEKPAHPENQRAEALEMS